MVPASTSTPPGAGLPALIPPPAIIERRLLELRTETILLRRLLRISQDRQKALPTAATAEAGDGR